MKKVCEYEGGFLNHMEGIYRPEDRDLAIELANALGLAVSELRFTAASRPLIAVHLNPGDPDPTNNVLFLYDMPDVQRKVVDLMQDRIANDPELREAMDAYRTAAREMPPILPHFGIRYGSSAALQAAMDNLENGLSPELKDRISVFEVPAYEPIDGLPDIRQVFVRTDVFSVGSAGFEQAMELQVDRARC